jgi:hypothetical protein
MNAPDSARPLDGALESDILSAVEGSEAELTALLATLVRFPSLLGEEASAQDFMEGLFQGMGLKTVRFFASDAELAHLPGYSPPVRRHPPTRITRARSTSTWERSAAASGRRPSRHVASWTSGSASIPG